MKKLGVIGHPISHSKSPLIHQYWMARYGCAGSYEALDIAPQDFYSRLRELIDDGYEGFNLTLPHKVLALDLCDEIDDVARAVGAVNTLVIDDGLVRGTNTDVFGFIENLKQQALGFDFGAGPLVVLGAGGAARACVYGLLQHAP